jgi:aldose 1-epimerase
MASIDPHPFGHLPDGRSVERYDLANGDVVVGILTYGAIIASWTAPNAAGDVTDVVIGFDDLEGWRTDPQYFGAVVGRYANRIRDGRFPLDGRMIDVTTNQGNNQLHGGAVGFDKAVWDADVIDAGSDVGVRLRHVSPSGDEGYPGTLTVDVTYTLDSAGTVSMDFVASTDAPTVVNLTNHVYWNLAGRGDILDHRVRIDASTFLEIGEGTLPTGAVRSVEGTAFDFRRPRRIGDHIDDVDDQLALGGGYDHCYVVDGEPGTLRPCATVTADGRVLEIATTQPGVQFYSGNGIRSRRGRDGATYGRHSAFCLETQHFPDAPNIPDFPSTRLDPGEELTESTTMTVRPATSR